ncbi:hypothetical protein L0244_02365 [bacterium]|nr:hypothetical protein [bacterium]
MGIAALERRNKTDEILNQLIDHIRKEISYPLLPPVVSSLSQQYFHIYPQLNLLCVPLGEADFLLHLPDLYHELAHPLVTEKYDPRVRPFQEALSKGLDLALGYIKAEQQKEERKRGPDQIEFYLLQWEKSWWKWVVEFFCDLFAVYTIGPAYVWAHFHLCAKYCDNPYQVPTLSASSHPADDARMQIMLSALQKTGFLQEKESIHQHWENFIAISGVKPEPEYLRCFPEHLLESLVQKAYEGVTALGCRIAAPDTKDPVFTILNQAWMEFWRDPTNYAKWERNAVKQLRELCASTS